MVKFLDRQNLWPTIFKLSENARAAMVAVAYVGKGASNKLPLKDGDILVTCMSLQSLRTGQVDPYEIEKFMRRGVEIYSNNCLHAKVYIFGDKLVTCSANLSNSSEKNLIECGILTNDKLAVTDARKFIQDNAETRVDELYLIWAKRNFIASKGGRNVHDANPMDSQRFWLTSTKDTNLPEEAWNELSETNYNDEKKISNRNFFIDYLEVTPGTNIAINAKEGDFLIEIYFANGRPRVHAPKRILSNTTLYSHRRPIIRLAEPIEENSFTWQSFKSHLKRNGIISIGKITERELKGKILSAVKSFFDKR